LKKIEGNIPVL